MADARRTTPDGAWRLILAIMAGLVAWGVFHGVGAWRLNHDVRRLFVVLACVGVFLGFWGTLLRIKSRALGREREFPSRTARPQLDERG